MTGVAPNSASAPPGDTLGPLRPELRPYRPPEHDPSIRLRLDSNEGPPPPPETMEALREIAAESLCRYPNPGALEARLAEQSGVRPANALVTAGGDDALTRLHHAYLAPGRSAVYATPTFEMIDRGVATAGAQRRTVEWTRGAFPVTELCERIDETTALVFVVSPNNPTGLGATPDDAHAIADRLNVVGRGGVLVLDLAYAEFDDADFAPVVTERENGVLVRTFSKAWSLAGMRLGYAVGDRRVIDAMRAVGNPYAVSAASLAIGMHTIDHEPTRARVRATVARIQDERARLITMLGELGLETTESKANFVLARHPRAAEIHAALLADGVSVRHWPARAELRDALRVTCPGDDGQFAALTETLARLIPQVLSTEPAP